MKNYIVFLQNGKIIRTGTCSDESYPAKAGPDEYIMEGVANPATQYIESDVDQDFVVDMPAKPDGAYKFNYDTKLWYFDDNLANQQALNKRNQLLAASDYTQLPDVPLDDKTAWATYRQELRDLPAQPGYPETIVWPVEPPYTASK